MALRQLPLTCSGHTRPVVDLAFSDITNSGFYLISACKDGEPMLRQGDTGDWIGTFEGHKGAVWGATLDGQAEKAATAAADFTAKVWDALSGEELHTFQHKHVVKSVDFSRDRQHLLTGSNEKLLRIFDLARPDAEPKEFSGHQDNIKRTLFSPDGRCIISASEDKTLRIWDVSTQKEVSKLDFSEYPNDVELSRDGTILTIAHGYKVSFFNLATHQKIKEFELPCPINTATLHHDKAEFVCGGEDFKMYKMDYASGQELESFKGHFGPIHCVRFSPDGEVYGSGSEDGTLRLWQKIVGKTYGLWKYVEGDDMNNIDAAVKAEG